MKVLLYAAIIGFSCWAVSEVFEIVQGGYSTEVYYLTASYHFFAGLGILGLYKAQTPKTNRFNRLSAIIPAIAYLSITLFPVNVMNSGLSMSEFLNEHPAYKLAGFIWFAGMILFSISVIRTGFYPKWTGYVMLVGILFFTATPLLGWPMLLVNITNIIFASAVIYMSFFGLKKA